ncbi:unnamed protein product [Rotaria sp. Silwood2]|nr:unnamed protein product [Rotaria sp. Silwood2]CAF3337774.1 unnamed protein product [Rotaria sp. Silwood2]CAF4189682.1 unnamed protein product [Rotaria sp. Silwood2]CAF4337990.1 unnamed protein product [Rotaria sp. Silwood2]
MVLDSEKQVRDPETNNTITIFNLPRFVKPKQLKEAFEILFETTVKEVEIPLDIADYSFGVAFVAFEDSEIKEKLLDLQRQDHYIFLRSELWNGPLIIKPYPFLNSYTEEEEEKLEILMATNDSVHQLAQKIGNIYVTNEQQLNEQLKQKLDDYKTENIKKEIERLENEAKQKEAEAKQKEVEAHDAREKIKILRQSLKRALSNDCNY